MLPHVPAAREAARIPIFDMSGKSLSPKARVAMNNDIVKPIPHSQGHFLLHVKRKLQSQLFIDRHTSYRRDGYSAGGADYQEVEANQIGAALLMPKSLVQQEVKKNDLDCMMRLSLPCSRNDFM